MRVLNFDILRNPLNWVTVVLMVVIFNIAVELIFPQHQTAHAGDTQE